LERQNQELKARLRIGDLPFDLRHLNGNTEIAARGVSGSLRIGQFIINVIPQFIYRESQQGWSEVLLNVAHRAGITGMYALPLGLLDFKSSPSFVDHVAATFAYYLQKAIASGVIRIYRTRRDHGNAVRGRVLLGQNEIVALIRRPGVITYEEDILDANNALNELILLAGRRLLLGTRSPAVRALLSEAMEPVQSGASTPVRAPAHLPNLPRQFGDYRIPLEIARALVAGETALIASTGLPGASLLLSTHRVFERFAERSTVIAAGKLGLRASRQESVAYGVPDEGLALQTRPDILVSDERGAAVLVIDAKYKFSRAPDGRPGAASDYYQLLTSMIAHKVRRGMLLFPSSDGGRVPFRSWRVAVENTTYTLHSGSLDLAGFSSPSGRSQVDSALADYIRRMTDEEQAA
jgi:5-methylcytosine-specific restriction endonuclease McrBC regulatory subunit McrC